MEKPRKIYCQRHIGSTDNGRNRSQGCLWCAEFSAKNETIDAMSTWLEREVPSKIEIEELIAYHLSFGFPINTRKLSKAIHELLKRKLTGKV